MAVYSPTHMVLSMCVCIRITYRVYLDFTYMSDPDLYCYSLFYFAPYDPEDIWSLVQRHHGFISVLPGGHYEFLIPRDYSVFLIMAFPLLSRQRQKDLYV